MAKIVECVPNISEGRNPEIIEAVVNEVRKVAGVTLLDYCSDASHNRSVITFLGEPNGVAEAAVAVAKKAAELIAKTDKKRSNYYNFYTGKKWGKLENYDLVINSASLGVVGASDMIAAAAKLLSEKA